MKSHKKSQQHHFIYSFLLLLAVLLLVSCGQHRLTSSWMSESLGQTKVNDVLVIGLARHPTTRNIFEKAYVEDLTDENIRAIPSHKVVEGTLVPTKEALLEVIQMTDAKTVLITRLANRKRKTYYQDATGPITSAYEEPYGAFFQSQAPQTAATKVFVYLESNIYDVESEKLIWSATAEAKDPIMTKEYMKKVTNIFIKDMKDKGLL